MEAGDPGEERGLEDKGEGQRTCGEDDEPRERAWERSPVESESETEALKEQSGADGDDALRLSAIRTSDDDLLSEHQRSSRACDGYAGADTAAFESPADDTAAGATAGLGDPAPTSAFEALNNSVDSASDERTRNALEGEQAKLDRVAWENDSLQRAVAALCSASSERQPPTHAERGEGAEVAGHGFDVRYRQLLQRWQTVRDSGGEHENHPQEQLDELEHEREECEKSAQQARQQLKQLRYELCASAQASQSDGKSAASKLREKEQEEEQKVDEVRRARLRSIQLRFRSSRLDAQLKRKEELEAGARVTDYEQLKAENQCLNEKVEERNDKLSKLRSKSQTTVQVLTHLKEKLQLVRRDNAAQQEQLSELDNALTKRKTLLLSLKQKCDRLRKSIQSVRDSSGVLPSSAVHHSFRSFGQGKV